MAAARASRPRRADRLRLGTSCQQYAIQSTMPNSTVAAITPKTIAARKPDFFSKLLFLAAALALAACTESTAPAKRYPVLDDVGSSDWQTVTVGASHTCALKADGSAYCWGSNANGQLGVARNDTTCGD